MSNSKWPTIFKIEPYYTQFNSIQSKQRKKYAHHTFYIQSIHITHSLCRKMEYIIFKCFFFMNSIKKNWCELHYNSIEDGEKKWNFHIAPNLSQFLLLNHVIHNFIVFYYYYYGYSIAISYLYHVSIKISSPSKICYLQRHFMFDDMIYDQRCVYVVFICENKRFGVYDLRLVLMHYD